MKIMFNTTAEKVMFQDYQACKNFALFFTDYDIFVYTDKKAEDYLEVDAAIDENGIADMTAELKEIIELRHMSNQVFECVDLSGGTSDRPVYKVFNAKETQNHAREGALLAKIEWDRTH